MSFLGRFFKGKNKEESNKKIESYRETISLEPKVHYEEIPGALDLGWYWSEKKEEIQMAKIKEDDRATHMYVIGASGSGKTKFLEFLIRQDILNGNGFGVIDPHGDLIDDIKGFLACCYNQDEEIINRVVIIDPTDQKFTATFNPLERLANVSVAEQAAELVSAFKKIWSDSWGVRMEDLLRNSLISLGEAGLSLAELPYFLIKDSFRKEVLEKVSHPIAKEYFDRFETLTDRSKITWTEPVMNKINSFLSDERIRQMFSSPKSSFNLREIMDDKKILLIKLEKGRLRDSADLLGSLLMAKIQMTAFSRSDIPQKRRTPFYLYIDEFQNFASESFSVILSEARKYGLSLIMAHQTLAQVPNELRSIILGNTGIQVYFRVSRKDAEVLAKEAFEYSGYQVKSTSLYGHQYWSLGEEWEHYYEELQNLPPRCCYVKHKIDGGMIPIQTVEIEPPWKLLGMDEEEYQEYLKSIPFGRRYLLERDKIEKERKIPKPEPELEDEEREFLKLIIENPDKTITEIYKGLNFGVWKGNKIRDSLKEKGLIDEIETRLGKKGRLAKFFIPNFKAFELLGEEIPGGRGGSIHRHLQNIIRKQALEKGYSAEIEKELSNGEITDVYLEKDNLKIAIEISAFSKPEREIEHVVNSLNEGFDKVICLFLDEVLLEKTKEGLEKVIPFGEREKVLLLPVKKLSDFL